MSIILYAGCGKKESADLLCFDIENTKSKTVAFDDIFEIEKIIILEETQESLVSHIIKVEYVNNNFFISDNRHSIVLRFDENGKYINSIGQEGNGPGEISRLSNFRIDNEHVYLLDLAKVVKYEIDGTFVKKFDKRYFSIDFDFRNNKYTFYNINVPGYDQFIITDGANSEVKSFSPLRNSPLVMGMLGRDYLYFHQGDYYFTYPYSDTIYRLTDTLSTAFLSYGFGNSKFTDFTGLLNKTSDINWSETSYSYKDFMTKDHLVSSLVVNGQKKLLIYNTETKNSMLIDSIMNGPDLINHSTLHHITNDGLMCWGYSAIKKNKTFEKILEGIGTNGNGVLIITTLNKSEILTTE